MKSIVILLFLTFVFGTFAQSEKLVIKEDVPLAPQVIDEKPEISSAEWNDLESALAMEDWTKTGFLADQYITKLKGNTKDGKLARLRYIYLYSLAGKVVYYSFSANREQELIARNLLDETAKSYVGEEFIFPVRKVLADCKGVVNYVCESTDNAGYLRISATNSAGTSIFFTEYIEMRRLKFNVERYDKADVVLGGRLKGVRLNPKRSNLLVMTLEFEDGFVDKIYPLVVGGR